MQMIDSGNCNIISTYVRRFPRAAFRDTIDQDYYDRNIVEVYEANGSVTFRGLSRQQVKKACEILLRFL